MDYVIKRNGVKAPFDKSKIVNAIEKAMNDSSDSVNHKLSEQIANEIAAISQPMDVEAIQNAVENRLMQSCHYETARCYMNYRYLHGIARNKYKELMDTVDEKLMGKKIDNQNANVDEASFGGRTGEMSRVVSKRYALDYCMSDLAKKDYENNEIYTHDLDNYAVGDHNCTSCNMDKHLTNGFKTRQVDIRPAQSINTAYQLVAVLFQIQSLSQFGGIAATHFDFSMMPYVRKSFTKHLQDGLVYIEKKSTYKADRFRKWLEHDENHPDGTIHFDDAEFQAQHPDAWDYAMEMTRRECKQATEGLLHNLNSLQSRSGNQLPFSSINFGLCTEEEGRMVTREFLEGLIRGTGKYHRTSIFPCAIFQKKIGVNQKPGDPNYDLYRLALKSTAQRLYPNYCNCDWSNQKAAVQYDRKVKQEVLDALNPAEKKHLYDVLSKDNDLANKLYIVAYKGDLMINKEYEAPFEISSTMGCRTWNSYDINFKEVYEANIQSVIKTGRLRFDDLLSAAQKDGRGNICPVTIILPTLAMEAEHAVSVRDYHDCRDTVTEFMKILDQKLHEAKQILIERFDWICSQSPASAKFMWDNGVLSGYDGVDIRSAMKHGTLAIGMLGMAETLQILIGKNQLDPYGMEVAKEICQLYKDRCEEFKNETSLNFGVYFTPAENLCFTAMTKFKEKYGEIPNVSDKKFFTNSVHVPVWEEVTPFEKIDVESQLDSYSSAGCILYTEFDATVKHNLDALETVVNYAMDHDVPYFAVNVPNDTCVDCGYCDEINDTCPQCGSHNIERLRRVTGYITGNYTTAFNLGKQQEVELRVKHNRVVHK